MLDLKLLLDKLNKVCIAAEQCDDEYLEDDLKKIYQEVYEEYHHVNKCKKIVVFVYAESLNKETGKINTLSGMVISKRKIMDDDLLRSIVEDIAEKLNVEEETVDIKSLSLLGEIYEEEN